MIGYFDYELKVDGRPDDEQAELSLKVDTDYDTATLLLDRFRDLVEAAHND